MALSNCAPLFQGSTTGNTSTGRWRACIHGSRCIGDHIPQGAAQINEFNRQHLNPYINYHRPCLFPEMTTDSKGKQRKRYPYDAIKTPYEKLKSLPGAAAYLKPGLSFEILDAIAHEQSDNEAADKLSSATVQIIHEQKKRA